MGTERRRICGGWVKVWMQTKENNDEDRQRTAGQAAEARYRFLGRYPSPPQSRYYYYRSGMNRHPADSVGILVDTCDPLVVLCRDQRGARVRDGNRARPGADAGFAETLVRDRI